MARVRPFVVAYQVSPAFLASDPQTVRALVVKRLREAGQPGAEFRGPRGGRYVSISEPFDFRDGVTGDDFIRNLHTFQARTNAVYVRPVR